MQKKFLANNFSFAPVSYFLTSGEIFMVLLFSWVSSLVRKNSIHMSICLSHPHVHILNKIYFVIHFMDKNQEMYDLCLLGSRKLDLRDFVEL